MHFSYLLKLQEMTQGKDLKWTKATDVQLIHSLLTASDRYHATLDTPAPVRNLETTRLTVENNYVNIVKRGEQIIAMFTLSTFPPRDISMYPNALKAAYMSRLVVNPEWIAKEPFIGMLCIRKAIELGKGLHCDCIRSEINPDLKSVKKLFEILGFQKYGEINSDTVLRKMYLQKMIQ